MQNKSEENSRLAKFSSVGGFVVGFIYTAAVSAYFGYKGQTAEMGVAAGTGGLLMAFCSLDKLAEFSAFGLSAKMREVVAQAEVSLRELQALAKATAYTALSTVQMTGRFGGFSDDDKEQIKNQVLAALDGIRISEEDQNRALSFWHDVVEFDYAHHILGGSRVPPEHLKIDRKEWDSLRDGISGRPNPMRLRAFLEKYSLLTFANEARLHDYEFYCHQRRHRRPDEWKRRQDWGLGPMPSTSLE